MFCKTCHYSLRKLTEYRCPECGRSFDPKDPETFHTPRRYIVVSWSVVQTVLVLIALFLHYLLFIRN